MASTVSPRTELRSIARSLLERMQAAFDAATRRIAEMCARGGKLDAERLDIHQVACYELALVSAELLAARTLVERRDNESDVDAGLALAFVAEAAVTVLEKLEAIYLDCGLDARELYDIAGSPELSRLRREAGGATALAFLGKHVADARTEIAEVELDEQSAMARDAFRRFAADVVAPVAEKIHRHDLTIPESLLQPMREMGVFGLSIPEEYGGSSQGGRENTPMMIAVTEALSEASLAAAGSLITRPEILARALMAGGTEAQKAEWLPKLAAGEPLCAIAITEPNYGSDVA